jgi:hypothetical protein
VIRVERNKDWGARSKSRQKEAAGAVDAVLMQIEWSEGEVLGLAEVSTEVAGEGTRGCGSEHRYSKTV